MKTRDSTFSVLSKPTPTVGTVTGNIISTTQSPSTNPNPTTLTARQFMNTLYFDQGTINPINAPTLSSVLTYMATFTTLEPSISFTINFVNNRTIAQGNTVTVAFPDAAYGRPSDPIIVYPGTALPVTFTINNANTPSSAVSVTQVVHTGPQQILNTTNTAIGNSLRIVDSTSAGPVITGLSNSWEVVNILVPNLNFGGTARRAAGFYDSAVRTEISNPLSYAVNSPGFVPGGYHFRSTFQNTTVFYVKAEGSIRATLQQTVAYTNNVLYDPATFEFGRPVSSARYKNTIVDAGEPDMSFLDQLRPRTFKFNGDSSGKLLLGLIAEELEAVVPEALKPILIEYEMIDSVKTVSGINNNFLGLAVAANQRRLRDLIDSQAQTIANLTTIVNALSTRVTALETP